MSAKIKVANKEYDLDDLSDLAKGKFTSMQFANDRIKELKMMQALLQRTRYYCIKDLKKEMISKKAGLLIGDD